MKLEEALPALREGSKIRHPYFEEDVYLMGCYVSLIKFDEIGNVRPNTPEEFEEAKSHGMSIVKMKGDRQHPDMSPKLDFTSLKSPHYPCISIFILTDDNWEIYNA